jgi:hypothetical protein
MRKNEFGIGTALTSRRLSKECGGKANTQKSSKQLRIETVGLTLHKSEKPKTLQQIQSPDYTVLVRKNTYSLMYKFCYLLSCCPFFMMELSSLVVKSLHSFLNRGN